MSPNLWVSGQRPWGVTRDEVFSEEQWLRIEPLLPRAGVRGGRPFRDHRQVVEGIAFRYRTGIPWRDLPRDRFGPWQTVWKRHRRFAEDGTWDKVLTALQAQGRGDVPGGGVVLDLVRRGGHDAEGHRAMVSETGLASIFHRAGA